jgi:transcriptional regulator EpsA
MAFLPSLTTEELHRYHQVVSHAVDLRSHFEVLVWLQGDMQRYLPHDIMVASWGNFDQGHVQHDIISTLEGVRSMDTNAARLTPLMQQLFSRWSDYGKRPYGLNVGESGFVLADIGLQCALGSAMRNMRSAMVHGINDERGSHDCLYVTFSAREEYSDDERGAMSLVLPYIDTALRQVVHLPHQAHATINVASALGSRFLIEHDLSEREVEILDWIAMGKTNPEIGLILDISAFTVKNHVQRVFKKLDVSNRAQAVSKLNSMTNNV